MSPYDVTRPQWVNSLAPGRPRCHFKTAIFNLVLLIGIFTSSGDNAMRWIPRDLTDDKSTLVQVMACCCQATSHYLSQCWPSSMSPYGVIRPQWVNKICNNFSLSTHRPGSILKSHLFDIFTTKKYGSQKIHSKTERIPTMMKSVPWIRPPSVNAEYKL